MTPTEERIRHYLNQLPEPYRSQALSQVDPNCLEDIALSTVNSRRNAVGLFAVWAKTKEGSNYWFNLYKLLPIIDFNPS